MITPHLVCSPCKYLYIYIYIHVHTCGRFCAWIISTTCPCHPMFWILLDQCMLRQVHGKRWKALEPPASAFSGPFSVSAEPNGPWQKRVIDMFPNTWQKDMKNAFWVSMCSMFYLLQALSLLLQIPLHEKGCSTCLLRIAVTYMHIHTYIGTKLRFRGGKHMRFRLKAGKHRIPTTF